MFTASPCARASRRCGKLWGAVSRFVWVIARSRDAARAILTDCQRASRKHLYFKVARRSGRRNTSRCCGLLGLLLSSLTCAAIAQVTVPAGGSLAIPAGGALNLGCLDLNVQGNVAIVGAGTIGASTLSIAASGVVQGGAGTISLGGHWMNLGSFVAGSSTVILTHGCGIDPVQLTGNTVFNHLTLMSTNGGTYVIPAGRGTYVNGALTLQGIGSPIQIVSSSAETAFITRGGALLSSNATLSSGVRLVMSLSPAILMLLLD